MSGSARPVDDMAFAPLRVPLVPPLFVDIGGYASFKILFAVGRVFEQRLKTARDRAPTNRWEWNDMNTFFRLLIVICACGATHAFAIDPPSNPAEQGKPSSPPVESAESRSDASATQSVGANAENASSKPKRIVLEDKTLTNEEVRQLFAQGYKPVGRGREVHYCRSQMTTGSRFATTVCKTADQIKQLTQNSKDMLNSAQKPSGAQPPIGRP